jgi:hypothetical protein
MVTGYSALSPRRGEILKCVEDIFPPIIICSLEAFRPELCALIIRIKALRSQKQKAQKRAVFDDFCAHPC